MTAVLGAPTPFDARAAAGPRRSAPGHGGRVDQAVVGPLDHVDARRHGGGGGGPVRAWHRHGEPLRHHRRSDPPEPDRDLPRSAHLRGAGCPGHERRVRHGNDPRHVVGRAPPARRARRQGSRVRSGGGRGQRDPRLQRLRPRPGHLVGQARRRVVGGGRAARPATRGEGPPQHPGRCSRPARRPWGSRASCGP